VTTFNLQTLIQAENDIDNLLARFFQGAFRKAIVTNYKYDTCLINASSATVTGLSADDGYYSKTVLEILSGANSGKRFAVKSQTSNVLTLYETSGLTNVTASVRIYQLAKAPFAKDMVSSNSTWNKIIDERIKEAVALQYDFREANPILFGSNYPVKEYQVSKDSYSEKYDTTSKAGLIDRIHPDAYELLKSLTTQSLT